MGQIVEWNDGMLLVRLYLDLELVVAKVECLVVVVKVECLVEVVQDIPVTVEIDGCFRTWFTCYGSMDSSKCP